MSEQRSAAWAEAAVAEHEDHELAQYPSGREHPSREQQVLERIERARRRKPKIKEERITLAHGAGGKATHTLIEAVFLEAFRNPLLEQLDDGAVFTADGARLAFTTDSFVVSPLFFPGGDIGELAVNGTVNDLAMSGARPTYLSAGFILKEGFPVADLQRIASSMARAAEAAGVQVVTGDTKVVQRGKADGCYINTTGVGLIEHGLTLGPSQVRPGDAVLVSGPIGDHGITIMLARGELDIETDLTSDTAPLHGPVEGLLAATTGVRCLRDATRGGVATILNEVARASDVAVVVDERAIPVRDEVRGASEILGIDPLYVASEGRFVAIVDGAKAETALDALRSHPLGEGAAIIGHVKDDPPTLVLLKTEFGGTRIVDVLIGDPLPRIC
ncbi:MAG: hydrogenase expression/formation protein HypE [Streptosporangiales bacterium]|nr:hydrogenase expression/formation protein HypE [Streptosporangiales bacterium]